MRSLTSADKLNFLAIDMEVEMNKKKVNFIHSAGQRIAQVFSKHITLKEIKLITIGETRYVRSLFAG